MEPTPGGQGGSAAGGGEGGSNAPAASPTPTPSPSPAVGPSADSKPPQSLAASQISGSEPRGPTKPIPSRAESIAAENDQIREKLHGKDGRFVSKQHKGGGMVGGQRRPLPGTFLIDSPEPVAPPAGAQTQSGQQPTQTGPESKPGQEPTPAQADPSAPPSEGGFTFAGRQWKDQAEAEQNHRSLQGQFQPLVQRVKQLEAYPDAFTKANESARLWKEEAERLGGGGSGPGTGQAKADTAPGAATQPETVDVGSLFDDETMGSYSAMIQQLGPEIAGKWLVQQSLGRYDQMAQARTNALVAPLIQDRQNAQLIQATSGVIHQLRGAVLPGPNGQQLPAFPELNDDVELDRISDVWKSMGLTDEARFTIPSFVSAISTYRTLKQMGMYGPEANAAAATPGNPQPNAQVDPAWSQPSGAGGLPSNVPVGGGGPLAAADDRRPESDADRIKRETREVPSQDPVLGFPVRKGMGRRANAA